LTKQQKRKIINFFQDRYNLSEKDFRDELLHSSQTNEYAKKLEIISDVSEWYKKKKDIIIRESWRDRTFRCNFTKYYYYHFDSKGLLVKETNTTFESNYEKVDEYDIIRYKYEKNRIIKKTTYQKISYYYYGRDFYISGVSCPKLDNIEVKKNRITVTIMNEKKTPNSPNPFLEGSQ
jgi:hypothetical protein